MVFVITFITSIPALLLYDPVLNDPGYITGAGADARVLLAAPSCVAVGWAKRMRRERS